MNAERWHQIESLLHKALERPAAERAAFLETACGDDVACRAEVESLLAAEAESEGFLEDPSASRIDSFLTALHEPSLSGERIGPYTLLRELGRGGMGIVYEAWDTRLDRSVALKFLSGPLHSDPRAHARLLAEARAASALDHPNICTIYEIGESKQGQTFIAMACYEGELLSDKIARGPLPVGEALDYVMQVAGGVARAHRGGIIHRDLKPSNILVTKDGIAKILDFGLAKAAGPSNLTRTGTLLGTVTYMSPEQARGEAVDARTDIWSLGVILYELLTGAPPFTGETATTVLYAILERSPPSLEAAHLEQPDELESILSSMLAKDRDDRFAEMGEVFDVLAALRSGEPLPALPRPAAKPTWRRRPVQALVGLVLLGLVSWTLWTALAPSVVPAAERTALVVFPFTVQGAEHLNYLHEGMVNLLSTKLDGVAGLRSVDPNVLLGMLDQTGTPVRSPQAAIVMATQLGARHFILGSISQLGTQLQLEATLYDAAGVVEARAHAQIRGEEDLLAGLDDLSLQLVASQLSSPSEQLAELAALTTRSFPALRAYLEGERALRLGHFESTQEILQSAIQFDSTFALAWYRLARAAGWTGDAALNDAAVEQAMRFSGALPDRSRTIIRAYHAYRTGDPAEAERGYRALLASYPDDVETWYLLGETLFHNNPYYGRSTEEAREPFLRVLAYDPENRESMIHLLDLPAKAGDWEALDSMGERFLGAAQEGEAMHVRHAYQALPLMARSNATTRATTLRSLQRAGPAALNTALLRIAPQLEDLALSENLAALLAETDVGERRASGRLHQALFEVAQGRWDAAETAFDRARPLAPNWTLIHRTLAHSLPFAPTETSALAQLRQKVEAWDAEHATLYDGQHDGELPDVKHFLLGLLSLRMGDEAAAAGAIDALAAQPAPLARSFSATLRAYRASQQGRPAETLAALDEAVLPMPFHRRTRSPLYEQLLNRYLRAEALFAQGRLKEALPWYRALYDGYYHWGVPYLAMSYSRQAQILDRQGNSAQAAPILQRLRTLQTDSDRERSPPSMAAP